MDRIEKSESIPNEREDIGEEYQPKRKKDFKTNCYTTMREKEKQEKEQEFLITSKD